MSIYERVIVDSRERASNVAIYLKALGVRVQYRMLAIGDYITVSGYAVERKEAHDFVSSLFSGRLFDQAARLSEAYDNAIIVVEGDFQTIFGSMQNPRAMWGTLSTLVFDYGLTVFFTLNAEQTADFLYTLVRRRTPSRHEHPVVYKGFRARTFEETKLSILSNLPGIGPKLAKRLLEDFGSLRRVFSASVAELTLINGVGRVKAGKVVEILESVSGHEKYGAQATLRS